LASRKNKHVVLETLFLGAVYKDSYWLTKFKAQHKHFCVVFSTSGACVILFLCFLVVITSSTDCGNAVALVLSGIATFV